MDPVEVVKQAIKAVPALKYALGVAGIAAVVAIIGGFNLDPLAAIFGSIVVILFMFVLVLFAWFAENGGPSFKPLALVLAWAFVVLTVATSVLLLTSLFFEKPQKLRTLVTSLFPTPAPTATPLITPSPVQTKSESEFVNDLKSKIPLWVEQVFNAQDSNGGIKESPSADPLTVSSWTTAQCIKGVLSSPIELRPYIPKIKSAFNFIESARRTAPEEGWNFYGDKDPYTVTEVTAWIAVAYIASLDAKPTIWSDTEREEVLKRINRDLSQILSRQDANGAWGPISGKNVTFSRTYSTIVALWSLIEAKRSSPVSAQIPKSIDHSIERGINWLLKSHLPQLAWIQNPNRSGQSSHFEGLTAQTLYVLSRAEALDNLRWLKSDYKYLSAQKDFIEQLEKSSRRANADNTAVPDPDQRFPGTNFKAEGSTFLWFPWTMAELSFLASESSVAETREAALSVAMKILRANNDILKTYVDSAGLSYLVGENLFCISYYVDKREATARRPT